MVVQTATRLQVLQASGLSIPECASAVRQTLADRRRGMIVLKGAAPTDGDPAKFIKFQNRLCAEIGPMIPEIGLRGATARIIEVHRDNGEPLPAVSNRYRLHTDAPYHNPVPDWMALGKLSDNSVAGGVSTLLHIDDWAELEKFASDPRASEEVEWREPSQLFGEERRQLEGMGIATRVRSKVFAGEPGNRTIRMRFQISNSPGRHSAFASEVGIDLLQAINESLEQCPGVFSVALEVGDLLFTNNNFVLHGRSNVDASKPFQRRLVRSRGYLPL